MFRFRKLTRREILFKLYKAKRIIIFYLIFIIASNSLSGTFVERAMRISLKH